MEATIADDARLGAPSAAVVSQDGSVALIAIPLGRTGDGCAG